jgi:hypothetical protein
LKVNQFYGEVYDCVMQSPGYIFDQFVRVHIGNLLYDVDHIDTVIDMDSNKPNIVIHVKEK